MIVKDTETLIIQYLVEFKYTKEALKEEIGDWNISYAELQLAITYIDNFKLD